MAERDSTASARRRRRASRAPGRPVTECHEPSRPDVREQLDVLLGDLARRVAVLAVLRDHMTDTQTDALGDEVAALAFATDELEACRDRLDLLLLELPRAVAEPAAAPGARS